MHTSITAEEIQRYTQQLKLTDIGLAGQVKLKNARVLCIGAGGLGSSLLLYLAGAGVGTIGIVDDDVVESSNLARQVLYQHAHIGQKKANLAAQRLAALNPFITVHPYLQKLELTNAEALISQYDIVADCSDNFATRYLVNDVCFHLNKPCVFASVAQYQGQCATFFREKSACFRCLFPSIPEDNTLTNCNDGGVLGVLPGLLGVIQATEILKWILNIGDTLVGHLLLVDMMKMDFKKIVLSINPECKLCVNRQSAASLLFQQTCHAFDSYAISAEELKLKLNEVVLIDVRSEEEHQQANLGGILIPLNEFSSRIEEIHPEQSIVLYCQSGKRSQKALNILIEKNFTSVRFLEGGMVAWVEAS